MSRDLMFSIDALDHAEGLCNGLDALVCLMSSCKDGDEPSMHDMAELVGSLHKNLVSTLKDVGRGLRQNLK